MDRRGAHRGQGGARAARARRTGRRTVQADAAREVLPPALALSTSRPRTTASAARSELYDPRQCRAAPDAPWSAWKVPAASWSPIDDRVRASSSTWPAGGTRSIPRPSSRSNIYGDREQRAALLRLGEWVVANGIDADGPYRAARDLLLARPPSLRPAARRAAARPMTSRSSMPLCRLVAPLDGGRARHPGSARVGQDVHRRADDRPASGRPASASASAANSHKVIGNFLERGPRRRDRAGRRACGRSRRSPSRDRRARRPRGDGRRQRRERAGRPVDGRVQPRRGNALAVGTPRRAPGSSTSLFVDEAGQMSLANVVGHGRRRRARSSSSATRSSSTSRSRDRIRPVPIDRRSRTSWATTTRCPEHLGLFLEHTWRLHPDRHGVHLGCVLRGQARVPPGARASSASSGPSRSAGRGVRLLADRARRRRQRVAARRRGRSPRWCARSSRADRRGSNQEGVEAPADATTTSSSWRPTTPRSARSCATAPEARVGHGRQVPGPGGADQHLLDDVLVAGGCAARHGLPVLPEPAQRRDLAGAVRRGGRREPALLRVRARTPEQMRLANALCQFAELSGAPMSRALAPVPRPQRSAPALEPRGR